MQEAAAESRLDVAHEKATNTTNVEYAKAAMKVARVEWQMNARVNEEMPGTVPAIEMERLLLTYHRSLWEIQQAEVDLTIAGLEEKVARKELEAAVDMVERHKIRSPLTGMVVKLFHHKGEWVQPNNANGDPVVHVVRLDKVRIEGYANIREVAPAAIAGQRVEVDVTFAPGRRKPFKGDVVFVSPVIQANGLYQVWAEVSNEQENGQWLLRPGLQATMAITPRD
jgi:multidrug resistance efflux pump